MKPELIEIDELLTLLDVTYRDLKQMLKIAKLPIPKRKGKIKRKEADQILYTLRRQVIDWRQFVEEKKKLDA